MRSRSLHIGAAVAAAALLLTGCGSGGSTPPPSGGADGDSIKIGIAIAQTGFASSSYVPAAGVAQAWGDWVNAEGGIDGHPVEFVQRDSAATPATALTVTKQLVEQDDVDAIMVVDAIAESAVKDYLADADIAVLELHAYDPTIFGTIPNFFTTTANNKYQLIGYLTSSAAAGGGSIGIAACAEVPSCSDVGTVTSELAPDFDMTYTSTVKASASQPNYTAECLSFISEDTDWIGLSLTDETSQRFVADCLLQGYEGGFSQVGGSVNADNFAVNPDADYTGIFPSFPWWVDDAPVAEYRDVVAQYGSDVSTEGTNQTAMWASLQLFRKALDGHISDNVTREGVIEAMATIQDETLDGLLPEPISYTPGEPGPTLSCYWVFSRPGGQEEFEALHSGEPGNGVDTDLASSCYDGPDF